MTKTNDIGAWKHMGQELAALHALLCKIMCDSDYNALMGKAEMRKLQKALNAVDALRDRADNRVCARGISFEKNPFYGYHLDPVRELVNEYRQKVMDGGGE